MLLKALLPNAYKTGNMRLPLLLVLAFLAACAHDPTKDVIAQTDICAGWRVIRVAGEDQLTDGTAKQILSHNCQGAALKCWAYPRNDPSICEVKRD